MYNTVFIQNSFLQKSDEKSAKYRNAGNSQFSRSKLREGFIEFASAISKGLPLAVNF